MTDPGGSVETEAEQGRTDAGGVWARVVLVLLLLTSVGMVVAQVQEAKRFSPLDELQHFDYMVKLTRHGELVRRGDRFGQEAMREEACAGLDYPMTIPPCGPGPFDAAQFNELGYNTASPHGPTYYLVSGMVARAMSGIVGSDSLFTTGRLTGALWLAAGVAMLWVLMAELGVGWRSRVPAILLCLAAPRVLGASAAISPDMTAMLAGAAVAWATLRAERTGRWVLLGVICALAVSLKVTNGVVVMMAVLYLVVRWSQAARSAADEDRPTGHAPWIRLLLVVLGATGLATVAWLGVSEAIARVDGDLIPMNQRMLVDHITPAELGKNLGVGLTPLRAPYIPQELGTTVSGPMNDLVDRTVLLGLGAAALAASTRRVRTLAGSAFGVLAVIGPVYVVADFVTQGVYFSVPDRYALTVLPTVMAVSAGMLDDRPWLRRGVLAASVVVLGFTLRACLF